MKLFVMAMLAAGAFAGLGCEDKKPEAKPAADPPAAAAPAAATGSAQSAGTPAAPAKPKGGW
jgi:hypothetical protein